MKINLAIRELHRSERRLARRLNALAARHSSDQDIYHLAHDLAQWSQQHVGELADYGRRHGLRLAAHPGTSARTAALQARMSAVLRKRSAPGLLLLVDLRRIHQLAARVSLDWELLAQAAQASKNQSLLELIKSCHPESLRQMRWSNAMLKELSAQVLVS
jgi:DNA-binding FadR family transcriptional regulator